MMKLFVDQPMASPGSAKKDTVTVYKNCIFSAPTCNSVCMVNKNLMDNLLYGLTPSVIDHPCAND